MRCVKSIVVTGGIASGKSTVIRMLLELGGKGMFLYDCDAEVAKLLQETPVIEEICAAFGESVVDSQGHIDKNELRSMIFGAPEQREKLEAIIHPRLAKACHAAQEEARRSELIHTFLMDIPLYFESKERFQADRVCAVAITPETQHARLAQRDALSDKQIQAVVSAQKPMDEKIERAHTVFWNEGTLDLLKAQVQYFFDSELAAGAKIVQARSVSYDMNELRSLPLNELQKLATETLKKGSCSKTRPELVLELCRNFLRIGNKVYVSGILEFSKESGACLRDPKRSFRPGVDDPIIPNDIVKRYSLRSGNKVKVRLAPEQSNKANRSLRVAEAVEIEGISAASFKQKTDFDKLTPLFPRTRLMLENASLKLPAMRVLDLITPLGMGQRALVVAPPRGGKTVLLKSMAKSIRANYPEAELLVLLLDERPEEVTDFEETVDAPVFASTFDETASRHAQLSDLVLDRARRLVEQGRDVIIMLDSLTRLARGYNASQSGGRTMSGGLGSNALEKPRKFFGAARNVEEGGSLTIIATCLVDTESRMDEIIFEEFKGTGNMEIRLDRELSERRIYPAISIPQSGTRNDDRLYHPDELTRVLQLRRQLATLPSWEALELLLKNVKRTQNNAELLIGGMHM